MFLALLFGIAMLLGSILLFCMATALIVRLLWPLMRIGNPGLGFWPNVAVMMVVSLVMTGAHLIGIALWAGAILMFGEIADYETAFYYSAQNYTALGYGDIVLSERWRILGPLEAINGLILFGLSTAVMFAVMNRLITNRLRHLHPEPMPVADSNEAR